MHVRKHRLKYVSMLPSLVTLLNAIFGFAAIGFAAKGATSEKFFFHKPELTYFAMAGYMIFLAMVADVLDGRLARMSKSTSSFGGQLDSLCDMVSFGIAPAFLMLNFLADRLTDLSQRSTRRLSPRRANSSGFVRPSIWPVPRFALRVSMSRMRKMNPRT